MDPFTGQFESAQHNAMDAVLWKAVELHNAERGQPMGTPEISLHNFLTGTPSATLSASLASAMEALGLQLTTKPQ